MRLRLYLVVIVVATALAGCAPAPRVRPSAAATSTTLSVQAWVRDNGQALAELRAAGQRAQAKAAGSVRAGEGIGACEDLRGQLPGMLKRLPIPIAGGDTILLDALDLYKRAADQCVLAKIRDDIPAILNAWDNLVRADNKMDELFGLLNARV